MLQKRNLPKFLSKQQMLDMILKEEYGYMPPEPDEISWVIEKNQIPNFCAGKAVCNKVNIKVKLNNNDFSFPVYASIPVNQKNIPFFICINFRDNVPDRYIPVEEIIDNGFAVLSFCYNDITADNDDFTNGLAGILYKDGKRNPYDAGKIAIWAWACQRVMDYAETVAELDKKCATVCGHSRLGKTALLAAACDERFFCAYSNDSGCSGAAISRNKNGEKISDICSKFPYWFCQNYKKYIDKENSMPFDQHFLTALIAPRLLYIASAQDDTWADPVSEMLNCVAIDDVYRNYNKKGFIFENRPPVAGDVYHEGSVGYHLRHGAHYFSREDWNYLMQFIKLHK